MEKVLHIYKGLTKRGFGEVKKNRRVRRWWKRKMVERRERGMVTVDGEGRNHGVVVLIQNCLCLALERKAKAEFKREGREANRQMVAQEIPANGCMASSKTTQLGVLLSFSYYHFSTPNVMFCMHYHCNYYFTILYIH